MGDNVVSNFLSDLYKTAAAAPVEETAGAVPQKLLEKFAADASEAGVDVNEMSDEDLGAAVDSYIENLPEEALDEILAEGAEPSEDDVKEALAKLAQSEEHAVADYCGRVMFHSMLNEAQQMEKGAGKEKLMARLFGREAVTGEVGSHIPGLFGTKGSRAIKAKKVKDFLGKHKWEMAAGAGGGAAGVGATLAAKHKSKRGK